MAISGLTSALIAAFVFGIVVNAATAALFLNVRGHGTTIFRDGQRLVLFIFLSSSALWAQVNFITILIDPTATSACQVGVIFTTLLDQLARFSIEQFLLWAINTNTKASAWQIIPQGLLAVRFTLGAVFVGLSKPQFASVCVPTSSVIIVAIVTVAMDGLIIATLAGRASAVGVIQKMQGSGPDSTRTKYIVLVLIGLTIWTATSVTMLLGIPTIDYLFRSTVPAGGLIILILIVTAGSGVLVEEKKKTSDRRILEAPSPRENTMDRSMSLASSNDYPPSRYEDLKTEQINAFVEPRNVPVRDETANAFNRPRGATTGTDTTKGLPIIANPINGGSGVGGLPVQGQLFPPMRANTVPARPTNMQPEKKGKKSLFDVNKGPARAITVGKLAISNPVIQQGVGSNPLDKVATTDLATAAEADKERRAAARANQDTTGNAMRVGPQPINVAIEDAMKRAASTKRKEVVQVAEVTLPSPPDDGLAVSSTTTGAQLSPAGDEVRRRSPRQQPGPRFTQQPALVESALVRPSLPPAKEVPQATAPLERQDTVKTIIRPSRQLPPSPKSPIPEPTKTPLQRRPSAGLPGNPKAMAVRKVTVEAGAARHETVMFVNDITYNDPTLVASLMSGIPDLPFKTPLPTLPTLPGTPGTARSVVNRPRPIPRKSSKDVSNFYPSIESMGHTRSKSAGSIMARKSILQSNPGSPTQLPPLPPPPQTTDYPARPQPNDTKSMTFDEKMTLFFPAPPSAGGHKRRSSVPDMPSSMPISFMDNSPTAVDDEARQSRSTVSKRTTNYSSQTEHLFIEEDEARLIPERPTQQRNVSTTVADKRASSPILPLRMSTRSGTMMQDDETIDWGTEVYSSAAAQPMGLAVHQARAIDLAVAKPDQRAISAMTNSEEMTIMLDTSVVRDLAPRPQSPSLVDVVMRERSDSGQWHRRVGDNTLSFSSRSEKTMSRRGPPTPLVLSSRPSSSKQAVMIQPEPSPLPSPDEALQVIQAQLKKYEMPHRDSVESPGQQRLALLEDLEKEMGQQETRWQNMQHDLSRISMSTIQTSPGGAGSRHVSAAFVTPSDESLSRNSSTRSNLAADRRASRRARMSSTAPIRSISQERDDLSITGSSRASLWQKRLAEAQMEYQENANELLRKRSVNFLSVSRPNLSSPTPPDTDESDQESESKQSFAALLAAQSNQQTPVATLWTQPPVPETASDGLMWVRPAKPYYVPVAEPELPGVYVRPAQRKETAALPIHTKALWQKPQPSSEDSWAGVWQPLYMRAQLAARAAAKERAVEAPKPQIQRSNTTPARPLTQKPPRRNKRVTMLPDIIEDPQPLPDKRGTLGIFQFPWGERSDTASIQPRYSMAMPGTMSSGGSAVKKALEARAKQLEEMEYSSSFFDDYDDDDEEEESQESDEIGSDSDDGFDESTLWEIASLLRTDQLPSKNSLLPPPAANSYGSMADEYSAEDQEVDDLATLESIFVGLDEPESLQEMPQPSPQMQKTRSVLWEATKEEERGSHGKGLPHPENWHVYDTAEETVRAKPRVSAQPAVIESASLWQVEQPLKTKSLLWEATELEARGSHGKGLPHPADWHLYDTVDGTSRFKPRKTMQPAVIESFNLWQASPAEVKVSESPMWAYKTASPKVVAPNATVASKASPSITAMWTERQSTKKGDHGVGLAHPENWHVYDSIKDTARAKPREAQESAVIESFNLWQASSAETESFDAPMWTIRETASPKVVPSKASSIKTASPLWTVIEPTLQGDHGVGLAHPENWHVYDSITTTSRAKPRESQQPAAIESDSLWRFEVAPEMVSPSILTKKVVSPKEALPLWIAEMSVKKGDHSVGLPQPENWHTYDNVQSTVRSKPRQSEPAVVETDNLWKLSVPEEFSPSTMWTPRSPAIPVEAVSPKTFVASTMWTATEQTKKGEHSIGLPHSADWHLYDNMQSTVRAKPRQSEPALIESQNLWRLSVPEVTSSSMMWSAPRTVKSAPASLAVSPMVTVVSSPSQPDNVFLWSRPASPKESHALGMFDFEFAGSQTTSQAPAAVNMDRKPRSLERKPLEGLDSDSLWVAQAATESERNWSSPMAGPKRPIREQHRPNVAFNSNWDAALQEAIMASYPKKQQRTGASFEQWEAALSQALSASYPEQQRTGASPAQWKAALQQAFKASFTHQDWAAALSEAVQQSYFDVSKRHPVFFGSGAITCPEDAIHPAMFVAAPVVIDEEATTNSALHAQIEKLEQDRQFAAQRARDSMALRPASPMPVTPIARQPVSRVAIDNPRAQSQVLDPMAYGDEIILSQIEELDQERTFTQQWARKSMTLDPVSPVSAAEPASPLSVVESDSEPELIVPALSRKSSIPQPVANTTQSSVSSAYSNAPGPGPRASSRFSSLINRFNSVPEPLGGPQPIAISRTNSAKSIRSAKSSSSLKASVIEE